MADRNFGDFEALARQYWSQWGEMMRGAPVPATPAVPGWDEALDWWSTLAGGHQPDVNDAIGRFDRQARDWYGRIQQLAAGFVGRSPAASEVVDAWKSMLGGGVANPFGDVFAAMGGRGQHGFDHWFEQAAPFLSAMQGESHAWLGMPAFGFSREHQERWQRIARLHLEYQERSQACQALLAEAGQKAFQYFEDKLIDHSEPGRQLTSARALFDLWIDAAEDAYAEVAMSPRYREDFGEMVNAQMRLRAALQHEVELAGALFGMPSRTEIDSAHRKIIQLERELRRLREGLAERAAPAPEARPVPRATPSRATAPAGRAPADASPAGKAAKRATAARRPAAKPAAKGKAKAKGRGDR